MSADSGAAGGGGATEPGSTAAERKAAIEKAFKEHGITIDTGRKFEVIATNVGMPKFGR